ncbi:MAG: metal ABC transporter ATP-binding protein [Candidatus Andersenbacteria bacterium]
MSSRLPTPLPEIAIEAQDLAVTLAGHPILEGLTFTVPTGQTTAIIGPNGAGKSILLKAILRLIPKTRGRVNIFGIPHEQYRRIAPLISYIPQKLMFDHSFPLTVRGLFALKARGILGMSAIDEQRMEQLLNLVGMTNHIDHKISTLSGGQMQRVLLGFSLMDQPRLLILDEPSAGIDVQGQETIYTLLQRIQQEKKLTLLLVSHELEIVMQYATQVLCLNRKLLCTGTPREVLSNEMLQQMYGAPIRHFTHRH